MHLGDVSLHWYWVRWVAGNGIGGSNRLLSGGTGMLTGELEARVGAHWVSYSRGSMAGSSS